ncbi:hypothetical protein EWH70_12135 [Amycolatopsis suaedae]|uniref:Uncharacterized protein n=1 Tax=Amycolatopsis suaedae TaxID=2510978 RepID=A0A4Q7JBX9_9PSEU|nr:hypothetical protein EWH70_12135 [Amycolatopsis suaedae]
MTAGCAAATEDGAARAAARFEGALLASDVTTACALLTPSALADLEPAGPCPDVFGGLGVPAGEVTELEVYGDAALVRTGTDTLFLRELSGGWKVAGAGCHPAGAGHPFDCAVGGP